MVTLRFAILSLLVSGFVGSAFSQEQETDDALAQELMFLQAETFVITATRTLENIRKTAASITVLTERDMYNLGARNLGEALRVVPGLGITRNNVGYYEIESRGIKTVSSEKVLIMLDSLPLNDLVLGTAMFLFDDMALDNVKQIEVIRGPGSALYGANAFAAVVNVITKTGSEMDGGHVDLRGGKHSTGIGSFMWGAERGDWDIALFGSYQDTDGFDSLVPADVQTANDQIFGSNASLAPGPVNAWKEKKDIQARVRFRDWHFDARYVKKNAGPYIGIEFALNNDTDVENEGLFLGLGYEGHINDRLALNARVYRNYKFFHPHYEAFPDNLVFGVTPQSINLFPNGLEATLSAKNTRTGGEFHLSYESNDRNKLVFGGTFEDQEQYGVTYNANFNPLTFTPIDGFQDFTDIANWNQNASREFWAIFVEDIWDPTDNLRLIIGARLDQYSDFGDSFNPRLGLNWDLNDNLQLKFLYGEAFRAPTFTELFTINNTAVISNPDLDAEEVKTFEVGLEGNFGGHWRMKATLFRNDIEDLIALGTPNQFGAQQYQNTPGFESEGLELEVGGTLWHDHVLTFNYTYQRAEDTETGFDIPEVAEHKGNVIANMALVSDFRLNVHWFLKSDAARAVTDPRPNNTPGYGLVNLTGVWNPSDSWQFRAILFNVFDKQYAHPSLSPAVVEDFPGEGFSYQLELRFKY